MKNWKVWLTKNDYKTKTIINGEVYTLEALQRLIGETLLECNEAEQIDANVYVFKGTYRSAGDENLSVSYTLDFEEYNG